MTSRGIAWLTLMLGATAFAVTGLLAARPIILNATLLLDPQQPAVGILVVGPAKVFASDLSFPKAGAGVSIDWSEARIDMGDRKSGTPSVRSIDRDHVSLEVPGDVDLQATCTLVYWLRPGRVEPVAEDVRRSSGMVRQEYGAVDLDRYLPRPHNNAVHLEFKLDERAESCGARVISRSERRFVVWHSSGHTFSEGPLQVVRLDDTKNGVAAALELVARKVAKSSGSSELPYLILDPTGPGAYTNISDGVLILRTATQGARTRMSLGSVMWKVAWSKYSHLPGTSLVNNIVQHGAQYLGMAAAEPEQLSVIQGYAIERYYVAVAGAKVRPVPSRPMGKENWHLLVPGLLAMMHGGLSESAWGNGGFLSAMSALPRLEADESLGLIEQALSHEPDTLKAIVQLGRIPGLECPAPAGVELNWFMDSTTKPGLPENSMQALLDVVAGANIEQYLELCGCKTSQSGGLARRATVLEMAGATCALRVDCGGFLSGIALRDLDDDDSAYAKAFLEAFSLLPFEAVTLNYRDVCAGLDTILALESPVRRAPLVCANLEAPAGELAIPPFRIAVIHNVRVAVLGWLGTDVPPEQMQSFESGLAGWTVYEDLEGIKPHVEAARSQAELVVLIGELDHRMLRQRQGALEGIDIVVTSDSSDPSIKALRRSYRTLRGRPDQYVLGHTAVLSVPYGTSSMSRFNDVGRGVGARFVERIVLDDTIRASPIVEGVIAALGSRFELDVTAVREQVERGNGYVGAVACAACHVAEHQSWLATSHATAMDTLQNRRRDRHASCVKCHVTGFGVDHGFSDRSLRSKLLGVQCEICHGPGERHATSLRSSDIVRAPAPTVCLACHDAEHSDQFAGRFEDAYWGVSHQALQR